MTHHAQVILLFVTPKRRLNSVPACVTLGQLGFSSVGCIRFRLWIALGLVRVQGAVRC